MGTNHRRKRALPTQDNNQDAFSRRLVIPFLMTLFFQSTFGLEFQQTVLPPRQLDRFLVYEQFSEIPDHNAKTDDFLKVPNQAPSASSIPTLYRRYWKQEGRNRFLEADLGHGRRKVFHEWHVYVDSLLEDGEDDRNRKQSPGSQRILNGSTKINHALQEYLASALSSISDYLEGFTKFTTGSSWNSRRMRESPEPEFTVRNTTTSYEVVNEGNTSDEGNDLDLYPYINRTDFNGTDDEYVFDDTIEITGDSSDGFASASNASGTSNSTAALRRFAPMRIRAILTDTFEEETGDLVLNETEREILLMGIIRPAMVAWGEALRVRRVQGNLTLDPNQLVEGKFCGPGPSVQVPREHINPGIPQTDFVLYLHVARQTLRDDTNSGNTSSLLNETDDDAFVDMFNGTDQAQETLDAIVKDEFDARGLDIEPNATSGDADSSSPIDSHYLCSGDYVAASAFCNTDQLDRPIAAILHLCIDDNFFDPSRVDRNIRTLMHEIGHSLGFNAISLAHFRHFDGSPRTPRLPNGAVPLKRVKCTGPQESKPSRVIGRGAQDQNRHDERPETRKLRGERDNKNKDEGKVETDTADEEEDDDDRGYYDSIPLPSEEVLQFRTVRGGVRVAQIVTPSVLQVVRNHFGCQTLEGAELESGEHICLGDHWERRLFKTDLMNPIIDSDAPSSSRISTITLAYFADSGWYQVDLSKASVASSWGRGAGCPFVEEQCVAEDGHVPAGLDSLFCSQQSSSYLTLDGCTHDLLKKASCLMDQYTEQLPQAYQYFNQTYGSNVGGPDPFVDYCPYYAGFHNGMCSDRENEAVIKVSPMERVGSRNSRCLAGSLPFGKTALCLRIACVVFDRSLRVQVDNHWYTCTHEGQVISTRLGVKVFCPDPVGTCPTFYCPRDCLGSPQLICDYEQGECVCPHEKVLPFANGTCPQIETPDGVEGSGDSVPNPWAGTGGNPFYSPPVMDDDPTEPSMDSHVQDIYFPDERALIEQTRKEEGYPLKWKWPVTAVGTVVVAAALLFLWIRRSRRIRRRAYLPSTVLDFPQDGDDVDNPTRPPSSLHRSTRRGDKQKMMATVVVDLRLQDQFRDVFVQDTETDAASMTDTEGDFSTNNTSATLTPSRRIPEEYLRPTIVEIPPIQPLEIECPAPETSVRCRRRRRFLV